MGDPFAPTIGERLWRSRWLLLAGTGLAAFIATAAYLRLQIEATQPTFEQATVLSFGMSSSKTGNRPYLHVMTTAEGERTISVAPRVFRSCDPREKVMLQRRGMSLRVAPEACNLPENAP